MGNKLKSLFFTLTIVFFLFFLVELFSKVINQCLHFNHAGIGLTIGGKDPLEYPRGYIKDRELFWKLEPSWTEYNSIGFRDREIEKTKKEGVFRIICIGDSVTFGWPSKIEDTFPKVLEKLLNTCYKDRKFEVFNFGVPGYSSYQGLLLFKNTVVQYSPNLVISYYGLNDRGTSLRGDKEERHLPAWVVRTVNYLRKSNFYTLCQKLVFSLIYSDTLIKTDHFIPRVSPDDYQHNLKTMSNIAQSRGITMLFVVKPALYDRQEKKIFTLENYLPPKDLLEFDMYSVFKPREVEAEGIFLNDVRPFNVHLTDYGYKIFGEAIFNFLRENIFSKKTEFIENKQ